MGLCQAKDDELQSQLQVAGGCILSGTSVGPLMIK